MKTIILIFAGLVLVSCSGLQLDPIIREDQSLKIAWAKNLDPAYDSGNLPITHASPFISDNSLFIGGLDGSFSRFDLETGRLLWQVKEKAPIRTQASRFEDLVLYGDLDGRLYARKIVSGELVYAADLGSSIESQGVISRGRAFFHLRDHRLTAIDASTGKIFWTYNRSVPYATTLHRISRVLPYSGKVIVGFADGWLVALSLEDGAKIWESKLSRGTKFVDVDMRPLLFEGKVFCGTSDGDLHRINPNNGFIEKSITVNPSHTPLVDGRTLVVGSTFGSVYRLDFDLKRLGSKKVSPKGISSMSHWKGGLLISTMGSKVFLVEKGTFNTYNDFNMGHDMSSVLGHVEKSSEHLAFVSARNRLYVLR